MRDLRTLMYLLNLELLRRMFENIELESSWGCKRMRGAAVEADAIGEQQPKRTRSGAAADTDASGKHAAPAEVGAIREQQLEADTNGKQQMKRMQSGQGDSEWLTTRERDLAGRMKFTVHRPAIAHD